MQPERVDGVGRLDLGQPPWQLRAGDERVDDRGQVVADHGLAVGRLIAVERAVEIPPLNVERRHLAAPAPQKDRDLLDRVFDHRHALRPTKTSKRRGWRMVCKDNAALDVDVLKEIGVVGVEHRPLHDRRGEIGRRPAVGMKRHAVGQDPPFVVEAHLPRGAVEAGRAKPTL